jgi:hypothetical protein
MPVSVPVPLVTGGNLSIAFAAVDRKNSMQNIDESLFISFIKKLNK